MKRRLSVPRCSKYDGDKKEREWNSFMEKDSFPTFKASGRQWEKKYSSHKYLLNSHYMSSIVLGPGEK
jgi:hypothetical protein